MYKKLAVVIVAVLLVLFGGLFFLENRDHSSEVKYIAVLVKYETDSAVAVLSDENENILYTQDIAFPSNVYFGPEAFYFTADNKTYDSISYRNFKPADSLNGLSGNILYHKKGNMTVTFTGSSLYYYKDGLIKEVVDAAHLNMFVAIGDSAYVVMGNTLYEYSLTDGSKLSENNIRVSEYNNMTVIDDKLYYVHDVGYTLYENNTLTSTFLYPIEFEGVNGALGPYLSVNEKGERAAYKVSFEQFKMILTPEYSDEVLNPVDFEKMYRDFYSNGYSVYVFDMKRGY